MKAQRLYDAQKASGFCSGQDIHELFREVLGDPSPPGWMEIPPEAVGEFVSGCSRAMREDSPMAWREVKAALAGDSLGQLWERPYGGPPLD